jgi:hypothetical protein
VELTSKWYGTTHPLVFHLCFIVAGISFIGIFILIFSFLALKENSIQKFTRENLDFGNNQHKPASTNSQSSSLVIMKKKRTIEEEDLVIIRSKRRMSKKQNPKNSKNKKFKIPKKVHQNQKRMSLSKELKIMKFDEIKGNGIERQNSKGSIETKKGKRRRSMPKKNQEMIVINNESSLQNMENEICSEKNYGEKIEGDDVELDNTEDFSFQNFSSSPKKIVIEESASASDKQMSVKLDKLLMEKERLKLEMMDNEIQLKILKLNKLKENFGKKNVKESSRILGDSILIDSGEEELASDEEWTYSYVTEPEEHNIFQGEDANFRLRTSSIKGNFFT